MNKLLAALIAAAFATTGFAADAKKDEKKAEAKKEEAKPAAKKEEAKK